MHPADSRSWHVSIADDDLLIHLALFIRDTCRLVVPPNPSVPPQFAGDIGCIDTFSASQRNQAGEQWLSWWNRILTFEAASGLGTLKIPSELTNRLDAAIIVHQHLFDSPQLDALAEWPDLRQAAELSKDAAVRWWNKEGYPRHEGGPRPIARDVSMAAIATDVADAMSVPAERLKACVSILAIQGRWASTPLPGFVLCSRLIAADADQMTALLAAAMRSGLEAAPVALPATTRKPVILPESVLPEPVILHDHSNTVLVCERILPYPDGFEIALRREAHDGPRWGVEELRLRRYPKFAGLSVHIQFADGREELLDDIERVDRVRPITVSPFTRLESGDDTLWLLVMPLPPPGEVRITVTWPERAMRPTTFALEGSRIRPSPRPTS
ncbi:hypothetical protein [Ferrimicrobium sp.]|uniref:hypothetical protein n=1 Tax=Ferrimicrobium sp. TaxID=2926050 RepID=UPI00262349AC|nr:hypothetical protein [Ferrimicrobium sp.]